MGLDENPVVRRMKEAGEASVGRFVNAVLGDERFVGAVQVDVSRALKAKGLLDGSLRAALATMHLPSTRDLEQVTKRLDELDRTLGEIDGRLASIEGKLGGSPAAATKKPKKKGA